MEKIFYLKSLELDKDKKEILSVVLQQKGDLENQKWAMSLELMELSMNHDLLIETDEQAKILVYTKRHKNGLISPTIKAFYPGHQTNLLLDEQYLKFHELSI